MVWGRLLICLSLVLSSVSPSILSFQSTAEAAPLALSSQAFMLPMQNWWDQHYLKPESVQLLRLMRGLEVEDPRTIASLLQNLPSSQDRFLELDVWLRMRLEGQPLSSRWLGILHVVREAAYWSSWWGFNREAEQIAYLEDRLDDLITDSLDGFNEEIGELMINLVPADHIMIGDLFRYRLAPFLKYHRRTEGRVFIEGSGQAATGKTQLMEWIDHHLTHLHRYRHLLVQLFRTDDYLRPMHERVPTDTQDIAEKNDLAALERDLNLLEANQEVIKPMVDTDAKGRWEIGVDAQNRIVLYCGRVDGEHARDGNREITLGFLSNRGIEYQERVRKDGQVINVTADQTGRPIWNLVNRRELRIRSGSTPIHMIREPNQRSLRVQIRQTWFEFVYNEDGTVTLCDLSQADRPSRVLVPGEPVIAMEVIPPCPKGQQQIIIGEGTLTYVRPIWQFTMTTHASRLVCVLRQVERDLLRGMPRSSIPVIIDRLLEREYLEDVLVAARARAIAATSQQHVNIATEILAEQILRAQHFRQLSPKNATQDILFRRRGLSLWELFDELSTARRRAFVDWLRRILDRPTSLETFKMPARTRENVEPSAELGRRSNYGLGRTYQLSSRLVIYFKLDRKNLLGNLSNQVAKRAVELKRRGSGLVADFHIEDFGNLLRSRKLRVEDIAMDGTVDEPEIKLSRAIVMSATQPMSRWLAKLSNNENPYVSKPDLKTPIDSFLGDFFDGQHEMWRRGLFDIYPDLVNRYGIGIFKDDERIQSIAQDGIRMEGFEGNFKWDMERLVAQQNETDLNMPYDIPELQQLRGLQRVYVRALFMRQSYDLLAAIPESLRRPYVRAILKNVPIDYEGLLARDFNREWKRVENDEVAQLAFEVPDVWSYEINEAKLQTIQEYLHSKLYLPKLLQHFTNSKLLIEASFLGATRRAWTLFFLHSLEMDDRRGLPTLVRILYEILLRQPDYVDRYEWSNPNKALTDLRGDLVSDYTRVRQLNPLPLLTPDDWEIRIFESFVLYLLALPPDNNVVSKRYFRKLGWAA